LAIVYGLALLIGGAPVRALIAGPPRTRRQHLAVWPLFALAIAAGILAYYWYQGQLHALGYLGS
jgi:type VI protein secretion system component VasF